MVSTCGDRLCVGKGKASPYDLNNHFVFHCYSVAHCACKMLRTPFKLNDDAASFALDAAKLESLGKAAISAKDRAYCKTPFSSVSIIHPVTILLH